MLHIILLILKILGFLLLGILGLLILLAAVFLISPVVYRADVSVDNSLESLKGKFRFHWLFRLISGSFSYEDGTFEWSMRAAWKRFGSGGTADSSMSGPVGTGAAERKTKAKKRRPAGKDKTAGEKPIPAEKEDGAAAQKQIPAEKEDGAAAQKQIPAEKEDGAAAQKQISAAGSDKTVSKKWEPAAAEKKSGSTDSETKKSFAGKIGDKFSKIQEKIKYTIRKICAKIKALVNTKEKMEAFLKNETHQNAFRRVIKEIRRLLRFLRPKKADIKVEFGFNDPAHTGYLLAGISLIYPMIGEFTELQPDFEHRVLRGQGSVNGKIRFLYALVFALCIIADKNVRTTFRHIRKFKL